MSKRSRQSEVSISNDQICLVLNNILAKINKSGGEHKIEFGDEINEGEEEWFKCYGSILQSIEKLTDKKMVVSEGEEAKSIACSFEEMPQFDDLSSNKGFKDGSQYEDLSSHKGFVEVIGLEKAKMQLYENVVLPLRLSAKARGKIFSGIRGMASNVLLHGPPGTGKTSLVRAATREAGATLIYVKPSMVLSKYHGESEGLLSALFKTASKSKSIIFFDEFDCIASSRSRSSGEEGTTASRRLLSELLLQLNQQVVVGAGAGAMVIAATNTVMDLDEAIIRRFAVRIYVGELQDVKTRVALIKHFLRGVSCSASDGHLEALAARMHNWSGSDVEQLVKEASLYPLRRIISLSPDTFKDQSGFSRYTQKLQTQVALLESSLDDVGMIEVTAEDLLEAYESTMLAITEGLDDNEVSAPETEAASMFESEQKMEESVHST